MRGPGEPSNAAVQAQLDELFWYHTIEVVPGATTKGWWDLRPALPLLPFPDLRGKRVLDVGTWDGFYAYEAEARGAAEVVAVDLPDLADIDWPPEVRADPAFDPAWTGDQPRPAGFRLVHELRGSSVRWVGSSIYDLDPATLGTFDVVIVGSLLVHLQDPVRALQAVRSVVDPDGGRLLSVDHVHPPLQARSRRRPLFQLRGEGRDFQWWLMNDAGYRHLLHVGGFREVARSPMFLLRPGGPVAGSRSPHRGVRGLATRAVNWAFTKDATDGGHLVRGYLTERRF